MRKTINKRVFALIIAVILTLTASVFPAVAIEHDPYIHAEYDYAEKGTIDLYVGSKTTNDVYRYGGSNYNLSNITHYYEINGKTAYCCWSNQASPIAQKDSRTKYYINNNAARAKAIYYFVWANADTPTGRNNPIAEGLPTEFLGKQITYYKDYVDAITDYARKNKLAGEFDYNTHSDDVMAYLIGHFIMDDLMNDGKGIRVVGATQGLNAKSPLATGVHKLVTEIVYNRDLLSYIPAIPANTRVFYCFPDRESGRNLYSQGLMSIEETPVGGFTIKKTSANPSITDNNNCYSLKDAEFTVYSDEATTKVVTTVTTDELGIAEISDLNEGTYYFKETKAPKNYAINNKLFTVTVKAGDPVTENVIEVPEQPGNDPAALIIFKNDPDHIEKDENGKDVKKGLAGVEFKLSYYDADPEVTNTLADLGDRAPVRTWILKTDLQGIAWLDKDWKVSGDDFYYQTNSSGERFGAPVVPIGCLTLEEIKEADGYVIDKTVRFARVTEDMAKNHTSISFSDTALTNDSIDYPNHRTTTKISKKSITTQDELPDAHLKVTDKDGKTVDSWISTTESHIIRGLTVGETYTLTETIAPKGYSTSSSIDFTVLSGGKTTEVTMYDDYTKYKFIKIDEHGNPLEGAVLRVEELTDSEDKFVEEWTTDGTEHEIIGKLVVGKSYKFSEVKAPKGYTLATPHSFKVGDDSYTHVLKMENIITKTNVSKKSITTQDELPGAQLVVKDMNGNIVDKWTSTNEEHLIEGLEPGKSYILSETIAPDGYIISSDIEFTVKDDGSVTNVEMYDDTTKLKFIKVDENGNPVEGAVLRIEEFKGNDVAESIATADEAAPVTEIWEAVDGEEWTTNKEGTPHEVIGKLAVGKRYRLVEIEAPKGYNLAAPVEFTVENTAEPVEVTMVNTTTKVNKTDITGEKEVPGATLIVRDKDGNIVDEWTSGDESHNVENLIEGETYTLEEKIPAPGYVTAEPISFTVKDGGISTLVGMKDAPTKIVIRKLDDNNKPVSGAKLQILDKDKKVIEEWTSDGKDHLIEAKLVVGETYTLHEVSAPDGYTIAKDIEFTVKDTADEQKVTMIDVYTGGSKISTPDQPTKITSNQGGGGAVVQTGQGTWGLMIAVAVIMLSAAVVVCLRKKRESNT